MAMNTRIDIVLRNRSESDSQYLSHQIYEDVASLEKIGSYFDPQSELSHVNNHAFREPVKISPGLFSLIRQAISYHEPTLGYFDVTVKSETHNKDTIHQIILSEDGRIIHFQRRGIKIDLSGFIKGYALEQTRSILKENNVPDSLVNMGNSSILALGNHPHGEGWKLDMETGSSGKSILLRDQCLTTSGNNIGERKHIIDPHTNNYIEGLKQISVITDKATDGEALSTALCCVMTFEEKDKILDSFGARLYEDFPS